MSSAWLATLFNSAVWFAGSIGLTATPSTPLARRSSSFCCCSAAVAVAGIWKLTSTSPSAFCASSVPARAMVQNEAALLETNASFSFFAGWLVLPPELPAGSFFPQPCKANARHKAAKVTGMFRFMLFASVRVFGLIIDVWCSSFDLSLFLRLPVVGFRAVLPKEMFVEQNRLHGLCLGI